MGRYGWPRGISHQTIGNGAPVGNPGGGSPMNRALALIGDPIAPVGNPGAVIPGMAGGGPPVSNPGMVIPGMAGGGPPVPGPGFGGGPFSGPAGPGYSVGLRPDVSGGGMGGGWQGTPAGMALMRAMQARRRAQTGGVMTYDPTAPFTPGPGQGGSQWAISDRMNPGGGSPQPTPWAGPQMSTGGAFQAFHNAVRARREAQMQNQRRPGNTGMGGQGGGSGMGGGRPRSGGYGGY